MTERRKKRRSCTYLRRFAKASIDVLSDVTRLSRVASRQIKENYNCPLRATLISKRNLFHEIKIDRGAVAITRVTRGKRTDLDSGLKEGKLRALYERSRSTEPLPGFLDVRPMCDSVTPPRTVPQTFHRRHLPAAFAYGSLRGNRRRRRARE